MAEAIKINETTFRVEDDGVRFFLLIGTNKALLVDSGMNTPNAKDIVSELTNLPIILINTHGDMDHISGNDLFEEFYLGVNEIDYYKTKHKVNNRIIPINDNEIIDLGNRRIKVINLPGHTPGSIALLDINNRVLIGGDSIQNGRIFMFNEGREMNIFVTSLEKLWIEHQNEFDVVYPSHGSFPVDKQLIPTIIESAKKIINKNTNGNRIEFMNREITYYDFGSVGFLCE